MSTSTYAQPEWREVAEVLRTKYDGRILTYEEEPGELLLDLQERPPAYVCFVATPEEAGHELTVRAHRMLRRLDADPYVDAQWGVVTGYEAADALRTARRAEPLAVQRGLSATWPFEASVFEEGRKYSEDHRGKVDVKERDQPVRREDCSTDNTEGIVEALTAGRAQFFATSGHATTRDWQMGYGKPNGQIRCRDGQLVAVNTEGEERAVEAPEPKIYIAPGNCLIGDIPGRDCMATAWMHTGGVHQMLGYTVLTWYGYMGWGAATYLSNPPGRHSFSEAFFLGSQALENAIQKRFPAHTDVAFSTYDLEGQRGLLEQLVHRHGLKEEDADGKAAFPRDLAGLLWDRDVVAFYGDPAWDARLVQHDKPWELVCTREDDTWTVTVTVLKDGTWPDRPLGVLFEERLSPGPVLAGEALDPTIADDFMLLPLKGPYTNGARIEVSFKAAVLPAVNAEVVAQRAGIQQALAKVEGDPHCSGLEAALQRAGFNREELIAALIDAPEDQTGALAFLISNMSDEDLAGHPKAFLLENTAYAFNAWRESPWTERVSPEHFLQYVLPYAHLNERRDAWRRDFFERYAERAWSKESPADAVKFINDTMMDELGVSFHATKRPKPDQSPYETIEATYGSCTGLSILLADAIRAVGIPCRIAGVPLWKDKSGNHSWVEYFDGQWFNIGSSGSDPRDPDWVNEKALKECVADKPEHSIYAATTRRTGLAFPLVWSPGNDDVPALNITRFYTNPETARIQVPGGGEGRVKVWWKGELVATAHGQGEVEVILAGDERFEVEVTAGSEVHRSTLTL